MDAWRGCVFVLCVQKPNDITVSVNGALVPASQSIPTISSPVGSNVLDPQARKLYIAMRGGSASERYDILTTQRVKLDLTLSVSVEGVYDCLALCDWLFDCEVVLCSIMTPLNCKPCNHHGL